MPDGSYNAFMRPGVVVEDPRHAVRLEDSEEWLGGDLSGVRVEEASDYLLHRTEGVTLGETTDWYEENGRPAVILETDEETVRFEWDADETDYVKAEG